MLYHAIINTSMFGVQKSMKGLATVEELVVSIVATVGCKISLIECALQKIFMSPKGARDRARKIFFFVVRAFSLERRLN